MRIILSYQQRLLAALATGINNQRDFDNMMDVTIKTNYIECPHRVPDPLWYSLDEPTYDVTINIARVPLKQARSTFGKDIVVYAGKCNICDKVYIKGV